MHWPHYLDCLREVSSLSLLIPRNRFLTRKSVVCVADGTGERGICSRMERSRDLLVDMRM